MAITISVLLSLVWLTTGLLVTEEDYLRGKPSANSVLRWRDFQFMPSDSLPRKSHANRLKVFEGACQKPGMLEPSSCCILLPSKNSLVSLR